MTILGHRRRRLPGPYRPGRQGGAGRSCAVRESHRPRRAGPAPAAQGPRPKLRGPESGCGVFTGRNSCIGRPMPPREELARLSRRGEHALPHGSMGATRSLRNPVPPASHRSHAQLRFRAPRLSAPRAGRGTCAPPTLTAAHGRHPLLRRAPARATAPGRGRATGAAP